MTHPSSASGHLIPSIQPRNPQPASLSTPNTSPTIPNIHLQTNINPKNPKFLVRQHRSQAGQAQKSITTPRDAKLRPSPFPSLRQRLSFFPPQQPPQPPTNENVDSALVAAGSSQSRRNRPQEEDCGAAEAGYGH